MIKVFFEIDRLSLFGYGEIPIKFIYEDQNYYVKLEKSIIICTSNYTDEAQIKKELGDAIYNRFDAIIKFADLDIDAKKDSQQAL